MTDDPPPEDARLRLAYEEGRNALTIQREDLDRLRGRAVTLISVAAVAAGLLGGLTHAAKAPRYDWLFVGVAALSVLVVCVCYVLAPHKVHFEVDPRAIVRDYVDAGHDLNGTLRWRAEHAGEDAEKNRGILDRLYWAYLGAIVALGMTVIAFALALTGR